jgi:uncharacterized membrane protein
MEFFRRLKLGQLNAHHRFFVACAVALLLFLATGHQAAFSPRLVGAWDAFCLTTILLVWIVIVTKDPYEVRQNAWQQDASATFLFTVVVTAATVSLFAVFILLGSSKNLPGLALALHIGLSVSAIVLSWMLVHTLFCLRYAHGYYIDAHKVDRGDVAGGLIFPGGESPDYLDFAYFSFVIGMTCQVSDVQVSSKTMRRLATIHGLISFVFNTAILAMFVNIIASLL